MSVTNSDIATDLSIIARAAERLRELRPNEAQAILLKQILSQSPIEGASDEAMRARVTLRAKEAKATDMNVLPTAANSTANTQSQASPRSHIKASHRHTGKGQPDHNKKHRSSVFQYTIVS